MTHVDEDRSIRPSGGTGQVGWHVWPQVGGLVECLVSDPFVYGISLVACISTLETHRVGS